MLMQNFKAADDLGLLDSEKDALCKTLVLLETGRLHYEDYQDGWDFDDGSPFTGHFNMATWGRVAPCGTVACIGGTADRIGGVKLALKAKHNERLRDLFEPSGIYCLKWCDITTSQAATALRSYLTTGDARWDLAVAASARTASQGRG